jgi:hypothetical protein
MAVVGPHSKKDRTTQFVHSQVVCKVPHSFDSRAFGVPLMIHPGVAVVDFEELLRHHSGEVLEGNPILEIRMV